MIEISERPLAGLFGSESAYQVLMYLENYENGYASNSAGILFQAKSGNRCIKSIPSLNA
jgi:hypothetical protein